MGRNLWITSTIVMLAACATPGDPSSGLDVHMRFEPTALLPDDVTELRIEQFVDDASTPTQATYTLADLRDSDGNGRRELVHGALPTDLPIRLRITALASGTARYVGHVGPVVLGIGERRYVEPALFPIGASATLSGGLPNGRFFHSATALDDGRVLISGGFDRVASAPCPSGASPAGSCFVARATSEAWLYDPSAGRFHAVQQPGAMREARGGHTATRLRDGRVLIAGGASQVLLWFEPLSSGAAWDVQFHLFDDLGALTALSSYEIFDPEALAETEDTLRDGDRWRGAFVGSASDPSVLGHLDRARFLACSAPVVGTDSVWIGGGEGEWLTNYTYAIFDARRAGGYGILPLTSNMLAAPRSYATAMPLSRSGGPSIGIFGGNIAYANESLAEIWVPSGGDPNGTSMPATTPPSVFPHPEVGAIADHPEWSLWRALVDPIDQGTRALVAGWYGPSCYIGTGIPAFPVGDPLAFERCDASDAASRNFTVDVRTGVVTPTPLLHPRAFAASAVLEDGRVVHTGGIASLAWDSVTAIDVFTGRATAGAAELAGATPSLREGRAFHTSTALPDGGVLTVGGVVYDPLGRTIEPVTGVEVLYLHP